MTQLFRHFIKDGNLRTSYQWIFFALGIFLLLLPAMMELGETMKFLSISLGAVIDGIGGYAAKASIFKIKPFDSTYKKARESYEKEKDNY